MTTTRFWVGLGLLVGLSLTTETHAQPPPFGWQVSAGRVVCTVVNSAATTVTAFGGQCVAPVAGLSIYVTDITASSSAVATTTADQYLQLKSGTGGSCGTSTAVVWAAYNLAFQPVVSAFLVPIRVTSGHELCWHHAAAGSKSFIVTGFLAP